MFIRYRCLGIPVLILVSLYSSFSSAFEFYLSDKMLQFTGEDGRILVRPLVDNYENLSMGDEQDTLNVHQRLAFYLLQYSGYLIIEEGVDSNQIVLIYEGESTALANIAVLITGEYDSGVKDDFDFEYSLFLNQLVGDVDVSTFSDGKFSTRVGAALNADGVQAILHILQGVPLPSEFYAQAPSDLIARDIRAPWTHPFFFIPGSRFPGFPTYCPDDERGKGGRTHYAQLQFIGSHERGALDFDQKKHVQYSESQEYWKEKAVRTDQHGGLVYRNDRGREFTNSLARFQYGSLSEADLQILLEQRGKRLDRNLTDDKRMAMLKEMEINKAYHQPRFDVRLWRFFVDESSSLFDRLRKLVWPRHDDNDDDQDQGGRQPMASPSPALQSYVAPVSAR